MAQSAGEDYDIDAVRKEWIGRKSEVSVGRYPVEYDPIRRHCHMVEDTNPLFLDPEFGAQSRYGSAIAPPVLADYFSGGGAWPKVSQPSMLRPPTRGNRLINMNQEMEFLRPVRIGDRLSRQTVVADVYEKPIKLDPKAVWSVIEIRITNQDNQLVAIIRNTLLSHRSPDAVAADSDQQA